MQRSQDVTFHRRFSTDSTWLYALPPRIRRIAGETPVGISRVSEQTQFRELGLFRAIVSSRDTEMRNVKHRKESSVRRINSEGFRWHESARRTWWIKAGERVIVFSACGHGQYRNGTSSRHAKSTKAIMVPRRSDLFVIIEPQPICLVARRGYTSNS